MYVLYICVSACTLPYSILCILLPCLSIVISLGTEVWVHAAVNIF